MFLQSDDEQLGLVLGFVFAVVAGVMALVLGLALHRPLTPVLAQPVALALPAPAQLAVTAAAPELPSAQAVTDRKFNRMRQSMTRVFGIQSPVSLRPMQFEPTQSVAQ